MRVLLYALLAWGISGCGDNGHTPDAFQHPDGLPFDVPLDGNPLTPDTLAGTGLCLDDACAQISPDVHSYKPQFALWADTATKRRWMYLPAGAKIDTSNPDHWVFPKGTKFWKEFTRDGVRVETRYIAKIGDDDVPGAWFYVSYQWNATEDGTTAVTMGVTDANGTGHDIPSRAQCKLCHENLSPGRVLGFQAIQLDFAGAAGDLDLDKVAAMGWLTQSPPGAASPHYPLPGNATEKAALGYLHANCGHCHNPSSTIHDQTPMVLRLDTTQMDTVAHTPTYMTTVDVSGNPINDGTTTYTKIIVPADPDNSIMIFRMNSTVPLFHMPNAGSEIVDPAGQTTLRAWINSL